MNDTTAEALTSIWCLHRQAYTFAGLHHMFEAAELLRMSRTRMYPLIGVRRSFTIWKE
jgi:hypothetical protein